MQKQSRHELLLLLGPGRDWMAEEESKLKACHLTLPIILLLLLCNAPSTELVRGKKKGARSSSPRVQNNSFKEE